MCKVSPVSQRLYRILLKECRCAPPNLLLQPPLDPRDYGRARLQSMPPAENYHDRIHQFLQSQRYPAETTPNDPHPPSFWVRPSDLKTTIRSYFRQPAADVMEKRSIAIDAIRILNEQKDMGTEHGSISHERERGIKIVSTSRFIGTASSSRTELSYQFAYRIHVENNRAPGPLAAVQLLGRAWNVYGDKEETVVRQPLGGLVGHQPVIKPGQCFEYMSGCNLSAPVGSMEGYLFAVDVEEDTSSAMLGDTIEALGNADGGEEVVDENHPKVYSMPIESFPLRVVDDGYVGSD